MKPHRNRGLFSNYYLDELLPKEDKFKISISEVKSVHEKVKAIWDKSRFEALNEPQLRKHFLDKVFEILDWIIDVEPPTPSGEWSKHPDYALFYSKEDLKIAQKATEEEYFKKSPCIGEAKRWGRPLDRKLKEEKDPFEVQNPSLQISRYLWLTGVKWGILTDGKYWRLYERETSKRLDIFYEVDLEELIESGSPEDFRYFYLLFRKDAFPEFIEKVYKESVDYAEAVGEELKENVYQALKVLSQGFLKTPGNNLSEANLKEIHDNSLILLYRLLFILYAEYRGLLPIGVNRLYTESYSLDAFKKEISIRLDKNVPIAASTFGYWNKLKESFEIINVGNKELEVPPYNGGLFNPEKHDFLEKYKAGDFFIAKAVDLLSRSKDKAYIDYGSLEIRHLGSIYEGLLEYKLKIADQDLVPVKNKGKEIFVSLQEAEKQKKKIREDEKIRAGEIYLITDKGKRKATGSYYTPDYIVKYIVENTLGPLVDEKRKQVSENIKKLREKIRASRGLNRKLLEKEFKKVEGSLIDEILLLKVLDPAMGSGHFLVEATDFLARELLKIVSGEPLEEHSKEMVIREALEPYGLKEPEEEDIRWARREVVEKCIFGVDLNPMAVELAKLSLWLYTVAKNRPLNFLDHHLRCGNSLIGARIEDLAGLPELRKKKTKEGIPQQLGLFESIFKEKINLLLGAFAQIEGLPSDTVEQIREKEKLYQNFRKIVSRFQDVADIWTSIYFRTEVDFGNYQSLQDNFRSPEAEWEKLSHENWFKKAKEISVEKRFFHWELEFPEVFFEGHRRKENPGFDVVIGNPPYGKESIYLIREYINTTFNDIIGESDAYSTFMVRIHQLARIDGGMSFIVPDTWLTLYNTVKLRKRYLTQTIMEILVRLNETVFRDAMVDPMIFVVRKSRNEQAKTKVVLLPKAENLENLFRFTLPVTQEVNQSSWLATSRHSIILGPVADEVAIFSKAKANPSFCEVLDFRAGCKPYEIDKGIPPQTKYDVEKKVYTSFKREAANWLPLLRGDDICRYAVEIEKPEWIKYGPWLAAPRNFTIFSNCRILIQSLRNPALKERLIATFSDQTFITRINVYSLLPKTPQVNLFYILGLINSRFMNWLLVKLYGLHTYVITGLEQLPIRLVNFSTHKKERKQLIDKGKDLYQEYMVTRNWSKILAFVAECLPQKDDGTLYTEHRKSDVVHDVLSFLVEQIIEMNKEKQKEIKGFLGWLESQLKIQPDDKGNKGIDALTGKSQIKNSSGNYQKGEDHLSFEGFWSILEKNRNRIQANLKSRELYETIKSEYEKSLSKLLPLKEKLFKTDWLIDQIVYKLYGLTEEEIKIVEGQG